ncbi:uncharacterized protein LOC134707631 isoform X2 [Mytilus trossulus]|uniref:uncharacterized protein LOC134707631 isoform X2 n=1 Tax=Mytilus trossulus TaxID=6551 RepID=UPI003003DFB1
MEVMMLMQWLVILLQLAIAFGSNHTDFQNLVISSRKSDWDTSHTSCHSLAGEDVFCNEYNTSQKCRPEVTDFYNMSGLPETFTAWIDSFLQTSYSITFDGCYEVSIDDSNVRSLIKNITVPDLRECALSCSSRIEDIGWVDGDCYCIFDVVVSSVSKMTALLSPIQCADEDLNRNSTVFNLYKKIQISTNLNYKRCPVGSYLGGVTHVFSYLMNCEESYIYYCNNSKNVFGPSTWNEAVDNCTSMSGRLSHRRELIKKHPRQTGHYWVDGFTVDNLAFNARKIEKTLCTALLRDGSGIMRFSLLNCSLELNSLCVEQGNIDLEIVTDKNTAIWKSVTTPSDTSDEQNPTTLNTKFNGSDMVGDGNSSASGIAIGITVVIVCIIVAIVCYRRKKNQNEEKLKYRKTHAGFKSDTIESDVMLAQNMRYLPSVITYPSGYNVSNLKIPDAGSVEQIGVNATIHEDNNYPEIFEVKEGQFKTTEVSINPEKIQFSGKGNKTEFEPGKKGDESDTEKSGSEDGRYISLVINQDKADDDDDRYVSIASPHFDIDRDNVFPRDHIESKEEEIGESIFMKNGLMVADEDDENIDMGSNEKNDNTEIRTKEKGASYEETDDDRVRADIQEMKNKDGGDKERANGNQCEVDISKFRALLEDNIGEPDMTSHLLRKFSVNDRIDSAIFK